MAIAICKAVRPVILEREEAMHTLAKPLGLLVAHDVMSTDLVLIPAEMSLKGAAHRLALSHVTGAPVVDHSGRCVGVISATDFMSVADKGEHLPTHPGHDLHCAHSAWQIIESEQPAPALVADYMSHKPVTVRAHTSLRDIAGTMHSAHIHRVVVVDEEQHPIGIVSSMDIMGAIAGSDEP
jgi:CBS domain-containing protein